MQFVVKPQYPLAMAEPATINPRIIEGLYCEALVLSDEVRMAFALSGRLDPAPAGEEIRNSRGNTWARSFGKRNQISGPTSNTMTRSARSWLVVIVAD